MSIKKIKKLFRVTTPLSIMLGILVLPLVVGTMKTNAASILNPGEIFILSVNTDTGFIGGPNSNGFEFVTTVDLDAGAQIYFTDKGWDGSLGSPFWRNTTGEGALRYTVPAGGIVAGTIVRYDDTLIPAIPTSGTATWDMYSIDPVTGTMTLATSTANSFDPATSGDNILVFQGTGASPSFLFGLGLAVGTPWISSGSPSANNSWTPSSLGVGAGTIVTLGTQDNYQYNCSATGVFSSGFTTSLQTVSNWNVNDVTPFGPMTGCVFDALQPTETITQNVGQNDPTNNSSISFLITFDQAIDPSSFASGDIVVSGTGSGSVTSITTSDNITWVVNVVATAEGTIEISLPGGTVLDPNDNPNVASTNTDNSVLYDITAPIVGAPDMMSSTDSGSSSSDDITNDTTPTFSGTCVDGDTVQLWIDGNPANPTVACSGGLYTITIDMPLIEGSYSVIAHATDAAGNLSPASGALQVIIDTIPPSCGVNTTTGFEISPAIEGYTDDPAAVIIVTIDGGSYTAVNSGGNWTIYSGTISPNLTTGQTYPITVTCTDIAGNININNSSTYEVLRHIDLAVSVQLLNTATIMSGDNAIYRISLTNTDLIYSVDVADTYFYSLVPVALTPPVAVMGMFSTSNPNIQCLYYGEATTIGDPFWAQYAGNNVFQCGFTSPTTLAPGQMVSFDISFVASTDIPDGLTYRVLIYDESGYDLDSDTLNQTAEAEGDAYGLVLNSVSRVVYVKPASIVKPVQLPSSGLVDTGAKFILPAIASVVTLGAVILATRNSK